MPSFDNEKNFNPHYMHLQIARNYDWLVLNKPLCVVEYQPDGMTNSIFKQYYNSPKSFAQTRKLYMEFENAPILFKYKTAVHYVASCLLADYRHIIKNSPRPFYTLLAYPLGLVLENYIKLKSKEN